MDFTAKLIEVREPVTGEGKNGPWKRQEYIFETESQYPRKICVQVWGDRAISDASIMQVGNVLNVAFDLESREFNGRWYTDVRAWRISLPNMAGMPQTPGFAPQAASTGQPASVGQVAASAGFQAPAAPVFPAADASVPQDGDDLPF